MDTVLSLTASMVPSMVDLFHFVGFPSARGRRLVDIVGERLRREILALE